MFFTLCIRREKRAAGNGKPRRRPKRRCRGKARTPAEAEGGAFPRNGAERSLEAEKRIELRRLTMAAKESRRFPQQDGALIAAASAKSEERFCGSVKGESCLRGTNADLSKREMPYETVREKPDNKQALACLLPGFSRKSGDLRPNGRKKTLPFGRGRSSRPKSPGDPGSVFSRSGGKRAAQTWARPFRPFFKSFSAGKNHPERGRAARRRKACRHGASPFPLHQSSRKEGCG